jgi:hypothetical protein
MSTPISPNPPSPGSPSAPGQAITRTPPSSPAGPGIANSIPIFLKKITGEDTKKLVKAWKEDAEQIAAELHEISNSLAVIQNELNFISSRLPDIRKDPNIDNFRNNIEDLSDKFNQFHISNSRISNNIDVKFIEDTRKKLEKDSQSLDAFDNLMAHLMSVHDKLLKLKADINNSKSDRKNDLRDSDGIRKDDDEESSGTSSSSEIEESHTDGDEKSSGSSSSFSKARRFRRSSSSGAEE